MDTTLIERRSKNLWSNQDFLRLWLAQTLSHVGSQVALLALPLAAILEFDASAAEVGIVNALQFAPVLLATPLAGLVADSSSRKATLIGSSVVRSALLATVPLAASLDALRLEHLYAVGFGVGVCSALFDVTYQTAVPDVVALDRIVDANSKMQASYSTAQIAGPGVGGLLVQALTAPYALLVGAMSLGASGLSLVGFAEQRAAVPQTGEGFFARLTSGLRFIFQDRYLRNIVQATAWFNFCEQAVLTLYVVFAARSLGLAPGLIGVAITVGAIGSLAATFVAERLALRFGAGTILVAGLGIASVAPLLIAAAPASSPEAALPVLAGSFLLYGFGLAAFNVHSVAIRQRLAPPELLGRVMAGYRFVAFGTIPLGALAGGLLGEVMSLRVALVAATLALLGGWLRFALGPVRGVDEILRTNGHGDAREDIGT